VGMQGNGPACSDLRDIGVVLASDNAVALDAVAATMMGCDPVTLPFLQRAKRLGLGDYNPASVEVIGELRQIPDFKLPPVSGEVLLSNEPMQAGFRQRAESRPHADPDLCTGCGTCVTQCPVSALAMTDQIPDVNPEKCIACFCCQEMCPEKAITLS
jgi:NAD-dependent dihydropyrimidine dehydrogenase PreA subunit